MIKHPRRVRGYRGSLEQLAKNIGNMSYDQTLAFVGHLADDINRQADADSSRGRKKLASKLYSAARKLYESRDSLILAWKISEPHMPKR